MTPPRLIIICGVSASGKSTIGSALAAALYCPFLEGDDYHPPANIAKMASGTPLTDHDRAGWIDMICGDVNSSQERTLVLSCSALTDFVQNKLKTDVVRDIIWIKLILTRQEAERRMKARDHFMPPELMDSQFDAWNPPKDGLEIIATQEKAAIISQITAYISQLD
jgi:gluconokinase